MSLIKTGKSFLNGTVSRREMDRCVWTRRANNGMQRTRLQQASYQRSLCAPLMPSVMRLIFRETSMKQCHYACWSLVFILCLSSACLAQGSESVCDKIERALNSKVLVWKITRKSRSPCQKLSYFELQSGKASVYIFIFPSSSVEEAGTAFESLATNPDFCESYDILGRGWRTSLEENRVWKCWSSEGVDLKKGRVVVRVSASTMKLSREFAEVIGDALPDA
jgi:hypothetical protein